MDTLPSFPVQEAAPALPSPLPRKRHSLLSWLCGLGGALILGGGITAYFVMQVASPAAGIPIPDLATGKVAFRVPEASLTANATYTREDGQIVHYIDKPTVIEKEWTEKNHHILIKITDAFKVNGEINPQEIIFGESFTTFCHNDVTHVTDDWYYIYTTPTFEQEKSGTFPIERFRLGNCKDVLGAYSAKYNGQPKLKSGDLVYVAIPPEEVLKLRTAKHGEGFWGNLRAATGPDTDRDGLLDIVELGGVGVETDFDSDLDGVSDGLEVAGGDYATGATGQHAIRHIGADVLGWSNPDTDWDGINDATELGMVTSMDPNPEFSILFVADTDPATVTNPGHLDTDNGGICDGPAIYTGACKDGQDNDGDGKKDYPEDTGCTSAEDRSEDEEVNCVSGEDVNANGKVDDGETDPNQKDDDMGPPLPPPLASGLNITVLKFDADGTELSDGIFDAATFRFSFVQEETSGLQKAELRDILFFVKSFNAEMAANGFALYNKHVNSDMHSRCLPLRDGVPFDTGVVSGTFLVECRDVPVSGVPAMITPNSNQDFVFRMMINNKQIISTLEYGLQVSLDQFTDSSKTAFGHNQSHVHWIGLGEGVPQADSFWANGNDPLRATRYGSFPSSICGNGIEEDNEECDDGNQNNSDGCTNDCKETAPPITCGNGTLENDEACDDNNAVSGDGCSALCATESGYTCAGTPSVCTPTQPVCGNGIKEGDEECDEGNNVQEGTCTSECTKTFCGDRVVQNPNGNGEAEECDEDSPICTDDCKDVDLPEL